MGQTTVSLVWGWKMGMVSIYLLTCSANPKGMVISEQANKFSCN